MTSEIPTVSEWFRNRNVFVTGGTGFMGKVLVYKLLLSCQDLGNVFLLVRQKKGVDPQARLKLILQQEPLLLLTKQYPERIKKIKLVIGDTLSEDLGLSISDRELLQREVSVVFHMAANVKFDLTLKESVMINTQGTMFVLELAKQMPQLKSFIYVSTCYSQCSEPVLEERYYPSAMKPENIITIVKTMSDDVLVSMTPKILNGQPNTYALSKALSEDLVQRSGLPTGVIRPSIVTASWKEPMPGWVEGMHGPTGLLIGAGKGVIRTFLCNYKYALTVIPCDIAINATIALSWKVGLENPVDPIFMNVSCGDENPISWGYAIDTGRKHTLDKPFTGLLWYPGGSITSWKIYHMLRVFFFHLIPAYVLDALLVLTGNKPFLVRVQRRISTGLSLLQYYTTKQWTFLNDRLKDLHNQLSPADKEEFFIDTRIISWDKYISLYMLGTRRFCLKDDPSTIPRAKKVLSYLYYADWIVRILLVVFIIWFIYSWTSPFREVTTAVFEGNEL